MFCGPLLLHPFSSTHSIPIPLFLIHILIFSTFLYSFFNWTSLPLSFFIPHLFFRVHPFLSFWLFFPHFSVSSFNSSLCLLPIIRTLLFPHFPSHLTVPVTVWSVALMDGYRFRLHVIGCARNGPWRSDALSCCVQCWLVSWWIDASMHWCWLLCGWIFVCFLYLSWVASCGTPISFQKSLSFPDSLVHPYSSSSKSALFPIHQFFHAFHYSSKSAFNWFFHLLFSSLHTPLKKMQTTRRFS